MAFKCLLLVAISCVLSVKSDLPFSFSRSRFSKYGLGACPQVPHRTPNFDVTRLYDQPWYMVAHYLDFHLMGWQCLNLTLRDANPGSDVCRVAVHRSAVDIVGCNTHETDYFFLLPNTSDHTVWIDTYSKYNVVFFLFIRKLCSCSIKTTHQLMLCTKVL